MKEFYIKPKEEKTIKITIGEKSYQVPLQTSLPRKIIASLGDENVLYSVLRKYIPGDVLDNLTMDEYFELVQIWSEESKNALGKPLGE